MILCGEEVKRIAGNGLILNLHFLGGECPPKLFTDVHGRFFGRFSRCFWLFLAEKWLFLVNL